MTAENRNARSSIFSTSCVSSVLMGLYVSMACFNLYGLMYPLRFVDLTTVPPDNFVNPLWEREEPIHMKVYLSTKKQFDKTLIVSEFQDDEAEKQHDTMFLWKEDIKKASLTKSFIVTSLNCAQELCETEEDPSTIEALHWLDQADSQVMAEDGGGILSTISAAAGEGIESTSILLTLYDTFTRHLFALLAKLSLVEEPNKDNDVSRKDKGVLERSKIYLPGESQMWKALTSNSTLYVHVVVVRQRYNGAGAETANEAAMALNQASRTNSFLLGQVGLVKHDQPNHVSPPRRVLYHHLIFLFKKYILQDTSSVPPWHMEYHRPDEHAAYQNAQRMKKENEGYPYFKPEVAVKYLIDQDSYPISHAHVSGMELVRVSKSQAHPSSVAHIPALHVDEIGLTSDKYIPLNSTVSSLPLRISFDRSDVIDENHAQRATATAGGISPARWRLLSHLSQAIESQKELGFEQSDIDDLRNLIANTNVTLLAITVIASALHLLFEFLTFKNEVSFWKNNKDLTGLSVRSLFLDMIGQVIIVLYLIEKESSLLMIIPSVCGCLVALWKYQRATGLAFVRVTDESQPCSFWNRLPRLLGFEFRATRLLEINHKKKDDDSSASINTNDLQALTIECDRIATTKLSTVLLPLVFGYTLYSFLREEHSAWYSWLITSASSAVYALGFALMTPQLFLNYKMKSVAHLPWRVLVYKSLNTFIDDLFSFIIRMPTMARISCFRDDVVFFIYLYQRWLYPVDTSRPQEGGGDAVEEHDVSESKKER